MVMIPAETIRMMEQEYADRADSLKARLVQATAIIEQENDTLAKLITAEAEIRRLETENWQLKQACGYPIPADKETPQNPFKCGICDARARCEICDPVTVPNGERDSG